MSLIQIKVFIPQGSHQALIGGGDCVLSRRVREGRRYLGGRVEVEVNAFDEIKPQVRAVWP